MYDPYVSHEMTIRDLLTHRSGMGLGEGDLLFWPHTTYTPRRRHLQAALHEAASSFRSHYAYDNLLYMTAGQIIPAVTGTTWDDYVRQRIFTPLGMNHTDLSTTAYKPGGRLRLSRIRAWMAKLQVIPFEDARQCRSGRRYQLLRSRHGEVGTTATESREITSIMTDVCSASSDRRRCGRRKRFCRSAIRRAPLAGLKANFADYALGWGLRDYHGRKLVGHTGGVGGFVSRVMLVPEENLGVVVLTNAEEGGAFDSILYHVLDHYFHLPPTDWIAGFKAVKDQEEKEAAETMKKAEGARAANSKPSLPLEKYAGVYNDPWYGPITIRTENGGLVMSFDHTPAMIGDLQHWQYDTFKAHWRDRTIEDAFVTFSLNPDGSIDSAKNGRSLAASGFQFRLSGPTTQAGG